MWKNKKICIILLIFSGLLSGCLKQNFFEGKAQLEFSTDTVLFDTVFTYVGSVTKRFLVYNPYNQPVRIKKIFLAGGKPSNYRININGFPQLETEDLILDPNDSIYIFVELRIDPAKDDLTVLDSIVFVTDNNIQDVKLFAVGQDVHFINGQVLKTQTWTDDKPYLIYNSILVDSGEVLTIEKGVRIYSHRNSFIYVKGSLNILGTKEQPVIMTSDRLEEDYRNIPGQWGGIRLLPSSSDNYINYAEIKEAFIGIEIDTLADPNNPKLFISNTKIQHCSFSGIYALATKTIVTNCLITDCGYYNIALLLGGEHYIINNTIYNDYNWIIRNTPSVVLNNYLVINEQPVFWGNMTAYLANNIIYGDKDNEFYISSVDVEGSMAVSLQNCLLKINPEDLDTTSEIFSGCIFNKNPHFVFEDDTLEYYENRDYHLKDNSPAIDKAYKEVVEVNSAILQYDLDGYNRLSDGKPDIGAFEFQK